MCPDHRSFGAEAVGVRSYLPSGDTPDSAGLLRTPLDQGAFLYKPPRADI